MQAKINILIVFFIVKWNFTVEFKVLNVNFFVTKLKVTAFQQNFVLVPVISDSLII